MLGAISGIGGGVIIKPMLDLTQPALGMAQISLLSSFSVLSMSLFSIGKNCVQKDKQAIHLRIAVPLAIGSTIGGVLGKTLFNQLSAALAAEATIKTVQNSCLFALMLIVLIATFCRRKGTSVVERSPLAGLGLSFLLGILAAFLGIGGGPLNMLALTAFYGLTHKEGALYSLFIIIFSQTAGIATALVSGAALPQLTLLTTVCAAGILGGIIGRLLAKKFNNKVIRTLYASALVFILIICLLNILR